MVERKTIIIRGLDQVLHAREILNKLPLPKDKDKPKWCIVLELYEKIRSIKQNKRYWAIIRHIAMCRPMGMVYSQESWHRYFALRHLDPIEVTDIQTGEIMICPRSTANLGEKKFNKYMEDIEHDVYHEFSIILPEKDME